MKGVQCYELFGGIALKNHALLSLLYIFAYVYAYMCESVYVNTCNIWMMLVC